jgi:hypothetical protein
METIMRHAAATVSVLLGTMFAVAAAAAEAERYRLEKSDNGYVRMDTDTGEMSICEERGGQLVCRIAADERSTHQDQVEQLEAAVEALEDRVTALENSLAARIEKSLPTEEDFERTMGYMERFFRSFMGIVKEFEQEEKEEAPAAPGGQKT